MCEEEASVVQMRPVEMAAPGLRRPVGGSVSYVLGLDAVVLGDGGVSSGDVGGYMIMLVTYQCHVEVTRSCVVLKQCCRVLSVGVCVALTGCQEAVTRM